MTRTAINGLGRIGRTFIELALENPALNIVVANDISDPDAAGCSPSGNAQSHGFP